MMKIGRLRRARIRHNEQILDPAVVAGDHPEKASPPTNEPVEGATIEPVTPEQGQGGTASWIQRRRTTLLVGVPAMLTAAFVALASSMYCFQYRSDDATGRAAQNAALTAATTGSIALLSYSSASLDHDLAAAKSHLTGDFLNYYSQLSEHVVAPAAKQRSVKTTAQVAKAAVTQMRPNDAVALLFINQTTTSADHPEPRVAASSVLVTVNKVSGDWLIAKFEPV